MTDFTDRVVATAIGEWNRWGNQTYDVRNHALRTGHKEGEDGFYQIVGTYCLDGADIHGEDGRDHGYPWSAVFISWVMKQSGAGTRFRYSSQHSVYIYQAIRDLLRRREEASFWCYRLNEMKPAVGDLVCWGREGGVDYDHQKNGVYSGHTDIVVSVGDDTVDIIGGNVGDSVTRRPLRINDSGFLIPVVLGGENLFGLMKNRL